MRQEYWFKLRGGRAEGEPVVVTFSWGNCIAFPIYGKCTKDEKIEIIDKLIANLQKLRSRYGKKRV